MKNTRTKRSRRRGFTLIEAIVIVVILGVLAAVIAPRVLSNIGDSRQGVAQSNASSLANQMNLFMAKHGGKLSGETPTIDVLWERPSFISEGDFEPSVNNADQLLDPWGNKFVLVFPGQKNVDFDIVSYGADGEPGGEGENADIIAP